MSWEGGSAQRNTLIWCADQEATVTCAVLPTPGFPSERGGSAAPVSAHSDARWLSAGKLRGRALASMDVMRWAATQHAIAKRQQPVINVQSLRRDRARPHSANLTRAICKKSPQARQSREHSVRLGRPLRLLLEPLVDAHAYFESNSLERACFESNSLERLLQHTHLSETFPEMSANGGHAFEHAGSGAPPSRQAQRATLAFA